MTPTTIKELDADASAERLDDLAGILHAAVHAGASVNFILPFSMNDSRAFWQRKVLPAVKGGGRILLVALAGDRIVGTVQLGMDMPPNQPHRCEVTKLLVHPDFHGRGTARALMAALEDRARGLGRRLITLDTRTGDLAEPLYRSLGYRTVGIVPGYSLDPREQRYDAATFMFKAL